MAEMKGQKTMSVRLVEGSELAQVWSENAAMPHSLN